MYYDLSLLPTNTLELNHLLTALQDSAYGTVAVDYEFADTLVTPPPESFQKLKVPMAWCRQVILSWSAESRNFGDWAECHSPPAQPGGEQWIRHRGSAAQKLENFPCAVRGVWGELAPMQNYDIISLDIANKLPFMPKRNPVY